MTLHFQFHEKNKDNFFREMEKENYIEYNYFLHEINFLLHEHRNKVQLTT